MDIMMLKQELLERKLRSFYVFNGPELAVQDIYINKIQEISGLQVIHADTLASIFAKVTTKTLFQVDPCIYVICNDEDYLKHESKWKTIQKTNFQNNIIILRYTMDKTSKFEKAHDEVLATFNPVNTSYLANRLQACTGMSIMYCKDLVKMCGGDYGRIKNELYKLKLYGQLNNFSWDTAFLEAKKANLIHEEVGDIIFEFTNAIEVRNIKKAYALWPKMKYTGDGTMRVLSVLYNSFRQILMVQSTPANMRNEQILGLTSAAIYITAQKCNKYNLFELVNIVKLLRYLEKGIKIGTIAEEYAMEYFLGQIW